MIISTKLSFLSSKGEGLPAVQQGPLVNIEVIQNNGRASRHAKERLLGGVSRDAKGTLEKLLDVPKLGAAARKNDAFLHDVGGQFRRRHVENGLN